MFPNCHSSLYDFRTGTGTVPGMLPVVSPTVRAHPFTWRYDEAVPEYSGVRQYRNLNCTGSTELPAKAATCNSAL